MGRNKIIAIFIFLFFFFSCEKNSILNDFYLNLENKMDKNELLTFKKAPLDSAAHHFDSFYEEYRAAVDEEITNNNEVLSYLKDLKLEENEIPDYIWLVFQFHSWLNKKNYSLEEYEMIYKSYYQKKINQQLEEERKYKKEALNIILESDAQFAIGDTLTLIFPVEKRLSRKITVHRLYPYSLEFFEFEDTLKLRGILIEKLKDSFDLRYKLNLTEISEENVLIQNSKYEVGDYFDLSLKEYGRPIK
jgi:hypothetical protein